MYFEICEYLEFETENLLIDIYPSFGTILLGLVLMAICIYTTIKMFKDVKVIINKIRTRKANRRRFTKSRKRRKVYDINFDNHSCIDSIKINC